MVAEDARGTHGRRLGGHERAKWSKYVILLLFLIHPSVSQLFVDFFLCQSILFRNVIVVITLQSTLD